MSLKMSLSLRSISRPRAHLFQAAQIRGTAVGRPVRPFQTYSSLRKSQNQEKKDDLMDRESVDTTSTENSKSGGDAAAAHEDSAFDPDKTKPEDHSDSNDSLNVSPGNPDVSKPKKGADHDRTMSPSQSRGERGATSHGKR